MLIYLDTVLWNLMCDQNVSPEGVVSSLAVNDAKLVLGTEAVYELTKTFQMHKPLAHDRATKLFSYLKQFVQAHILSVRMTSDVLGEEMDRTSGRTKSTRVFLDEHDYVGLTQEVNKLAAGNFDQRANHFISERKDIAAAMRSDIVEHYRSHPRMKASLAAIPLEDLKGWIQKELRKHGRAVLKSQILHTFPETTPRDATRLAKRLLSSSTYRVSHAMTRADLYFNWRFAQADSISRDLPDDLYHMVNAAYCDTYATKERKQGLYAPLVLTRTATRVYEGAASLAEWLTALPNKLSRLSE